MDMSTVIFEGNEVEAFRADDMPVIRQAERYLVDGEVGGTLDGFTGTIKRVIRKGGFTDDSGNRCYNSAVVVEIPVTCEGLAISDVLHRLMESAGNAIDIDGDIPFSINLANTAKVQVATGGAGKATIPEEYKIVAVKLRKMVKASSKPENSKLYTASYVQELAGTNVKVAEMVAKIGRAHV